MLVVNEVSVMSLKRLLVGTSGNLGLQILCISETAVYILLLVLL